MALKILVVGAGVCGPAFATLLQRSLRGHDITILERFSSVRATGQQIDVKREAPQILQKMGLLEEVKSRCVDESGLSVVDAAGRSVATFGVAPAGERKPALTSEYEIMRGDLVQIMYDASLRQDADLRAGATPGHGSVKYIFDETITSLEQDKDGVSVALKSGNTRRYDLVVAADGQASRTRRLAFGKEFDEAAFKSLGIYAAYYTIPHVEREGTLAECFIGTAGRMVFTRPSGRPVTGVLAFTPTKPVPKLASAHDSKSVDAYKDAFINIFKGCAWQEARLLEGMKASDDFYWNELGQIKTERLFTGRVVLLGDAGYGPSPFTGMGANLSLLGAYVLAGAVARHGDDLGKALETYQSSVLPKVREYQDMPTWLPRLFPSSYLGVLLIRVAAWVVSKIFQRRLEGQGESGREDTLLEYPELNLP